MPQKSRAAKISIDIGEHSVNIIKIKGSGVIIKAGSAELPAGIPVSPDIKYKVALASAITKAAKAAKIRGGGDCVMVVGGPQIITRSFVWPEMPPDALQFNAESEITHYLPSEIEQFIVDYRIQRRTVTKRDGNTGAQLDVLVAAMAKDMTSALLTAAKMSGFNPIRIDIRENAREKLVRTSRLWQNNNTRPNFKRPAKISASGGQIHDYVFDPNGSFAVLNATDSLVDMTVFVNGVFYASRYFSPNVKSVIYAEHGQGESVHTQNDVPVSDNSGLLSEIVSTIDYIQYRERGIKVENILLFGDERISKSLMESLSEYLGISVLLLSERFSSIVKPSKRGKMNAPLFLDAYGAAIIPTANALMDLNLKPKKKRRHIFKRFVLPALCLILILGAFLAAGIYLPFMRILELEKQEENLTEELTRYTIPGDVTELQSEVTLITKTIEEIDKFYLPHSASEIMSAIHTALPSNTVIDRITIDKRQISLSGTTDKLEKVAGFIRSLDSNKLFASANAQTANSYSATDGSTVEFDITLTFTYSEDDE